MYRWIILFIVVGIVEFYAWQAFKVGFDNKWVQRGYLTISLFVIVFIVMIMTNFDRKTGQTQMTLLALGLLLLVYIPKLLVMVFLITEDILLGLPPAALSS